MSTIEYRTVSTPPVLTRADDDAAPPHFHGTPIVYGQRTLIGRLPWGFYEEIAPGSASRSIAAGDLVFLVDHDTGKPVARQSAGTLTVTEDDASVYFDAPLDVRKSYVSDLALNLADGTVRGMSFGFYVVKDKWETLTVDVDGITYEAELRTVLDMDVFEGSAVTFPAFDMTEAGLRDAVSTARSGRPAPTLRAPGGLPAHDLVRATAAFHRLTLPA